MTSTPTRLRPLWREALKSPAATALCLIILVAITFHVASYNRGYETSTLASLLHPPWRGTAHGRMGPELYVVRDGDRWHVATPDEDSWDAMTRNLAGGVLPVLIVRLHTRNSAAGFWALTTRTWTAQAIASPLTGDWPPADVRRAREAVRPLWGAIVTPADADAVVQTGCAARTETLWSGYFLNLLTIASLAAFCCSFAWVPQVIRDRRRHRRAHALHGGRCPRCGYAIANLPEPQCPECGELLLIEAAQSSE